MVRKEMLKQVQHDTMYYIKKHFNVFTNPIFLLLIFNLIFFIKPIVNGLYLSPADILQRFPSFNLGEFYSPKNSLLFDAVTQFQPWYKYAKETILKGDLPLWNHSNGGGVPFFANSISALLFPPSFVFYFLDFQKALIIFHFSKLFLIGLFTFLFLRELKIEKYASLVGAVAFNFASFNIVWLLWPQTNVVIFLPLTLLFIEKLLNNSWSKAHVFVGLSLSMVFSVSAGHPETLFHILIASLAYFAFRITGKGFSRKERIVKSKFFAMSSLMGLLLSGILIVPFAEYLFHSWAFHERSIGESGQLLPIWASIYNIFPNLSGNPATAYYKPLIANSNYNELTGAYVGPLILFFSIMAILFLIHKERKFQFFAILSLAILPFVYNIPLLSGFTQGLSKIVANTRLLFVLAFSQVVLASKFLDELPKLRTSKKLFWIVMISVTIASLIYLMLLNIYGPKVLSSFNPQKVGEFIGYERKQVLFLVSIYISGIILINLSTLSKKFQFFVIICLAVFVFLQTGFLNRNYNPTIEGKYFYPENEDIRFLQDLPKGKYMELRGDNVIPAGINLWYGLANVDNYDAIDIKEYKEVYNRAFTEKTEWDTILKAKPEDLNLFGVKYVLSYTDIDKKIVLDQKKAEKLAGELVSGRSLEQEFTASGDNLTSIRVLPANFNRLNYCNFIFKLFDGHDNLLFENKYRCQEIFDKIYFQINFPKIADSKGKRFTFILRVPDGRFGNSVSFWQNNEGKLVFQTIYDEAGNPNLKLIHSGRFKVYENEMAFPEYYLVETEANIPTPVNIEISESGYKKIVLNPNDEGVLSSTNAYYPGWKVYIDSKKAKIIRVNQAFQGVFIPKGSQVVELIYDPDSFYIGVFSGLLGLFLLLTLPSRISNYDQKK